jgi:hypothetical protein
MIPKTWGPIIRIDREDSQVRVLAKNRLSVNKQKRGNVAA